MSKVLSIVNEFIERTMNTYMVVISVYAGFLILSLFEHFEKNGILTNGEKVWLVLLFVMPFLWPFAKSVIVAVDKLFDRVQQIKKKRIEQQSIEQQ